MSEKKTKMQNKNAKELAKTKLTDRMTIKRLENETRSLDVWSAFRAFVLNILQKNTIFFRITGNRKQTLSERAIEEK